MSEARDGFAAMDARRASSARSSSPADGHPSGHRRRLRDRYVGRRRAARARRRPGAAGATRRAGSRAAPSASPAPHRSSSTWPTPTRSTALDRLDGLPSRLDSVLHIAGIVELAPVAELSTRHLREQIDVNLVSPALLTRACLPALRAARGTVVFVNSGAGPVRGRLVGGVRRVEVRAARPRRLAARRGDGPRRPRDDGLPVAHRDPDAGEGARAGGWHLRRVAVDQSRRPSRPRSSTCSTCRGTRRSPR